MHFEKRRGGGCHPALDHTQVLKTTGESSNGGFGEVQREKEMRDDTPSMIAHVEKFARKNKCFMHVQFSHLKQHQRRGGHIPATAENCFLNHDAPATQHLLVPMVMMGPMHHCG